MIVEMIFQDSIVGDVGVSFICNKNVI